MDLHCTHCNRVIEYLREPPKFCSFCGGELSDTGTGGLSDDTHTFHDRERGGAGDVPEVIAGYRLLRELGRGGMGVVFEAEQESTGRRVAIKLLSRNVRRTDDTVRRFMQEGELAASLSHPRSTFIYAAGEEDGQFFIVMELMSGGTLKDLVQREKKLSIERAVDFTLDIIEGLAAAHAAGVIHRDVKPSNCFLDQQGRAKVGDYGLSKSLVSNAALTQTGAFMGTPQFAAPEQIKGGRIDESTDVYAVGATLYCLLTGQPPFAGDAARVIAGIASDPAPPVRSLVAEIPKQLERVIAQALAKNPAQRPRNLAQLRQSIMPFSSRGASIADLGRRLAAFFIDMIVIGVLAFSANAAMMLAFGLVTLAGGGAGFQGPETFVSPPVQLTIFLTTILVSIGYFAVTERWWSCGVGKKMMGLRVVGVHGETPAWFSTLIRATILPGLMLVCQRLLPMLVGSPATPNWSAPVPSELLVTIFVQNAYPLAGWLVTILCLVTMRRGNGHRGLHELASRTRVIRAHGEAELDWAAAVPVTLPQQAGPQSYGSFQRTGLLSHHGHFDVFTATDVALSRPVWILERARDTLPMTPHRVAVSRPTRQFWLDGGQLEDQRWDALEAVHGSPLTELLSQPHKLNWQQTRGIFLELTDELLASLAEGTVPPTLQPAQVWLDRTGRLKLLDVALDPLPESSQAVDFGLAETVESEAAAAMRLVRTLLGLAQRHQLSPGHVINFFARLEQLPDTAETLHWTREQLRLMVDRPSTLGWDDRLGVLAVSFCTELTIYSTLAFLLSLGILGLLGFDGPWALPILAAGLFCLAVPMLLGALLRGGPVFHLTGVEVRSRDGTRASRLRCGCRSLLSWFLTLLGHLALGTMLAVLLLVGRDGAMDPIDSVWVLALFMIWMGASLLQAIGALYAVFRPQRGLQDLLAGTRLVPS